jgi:Zn-dependent peptidase ImmA (M78 family)/transcriptional regulator with XRE-family HTH domain
MSTTLDDWWADRTVVPAAVTVGRELRRMSQSDLARRSGVARQHVVNIESGSVRRPAAATINAIATALELPPGFFTREPAPGPSLEVLHFRGRARVTGRVGAGLLALAKVWVGFTRSLEEQCTRLPVDALSSINSDGDIEQVAARARQQWGLRDDTPVHNVTRLAERAGVFVGSFAGGEKGLDAFSWQAERPHLLSNVERLSPSRWRFSVLHEVGHLVMHRGRRTGDEQTETEANRFASAVLLPRRAFWQEFPRNGSRLNWDGMFRMKERWGASVQSIVARAHDLGIINAIEYRRAFVIMSSKGWRIDEPGEPPEGERPELIPRIIESLMRTKKLALGQVHGDFWLPVEMVSEMTCLSASTLVKPEQTVVKIGAPISRALHAPKN